MNTTGFKFGPFGQGVTHLCVDMQRMFSEDTPWKVDWFPKILPRIVEITASISERTIFTRFIPPEKAEDAQGTWKRYYGRWKCMTTSELPAEMIEIVPELARFCPPARLYDKAGYGPWLGGSLRKTLDDMKTDTVILTGGETDVCVLATVMGAIDIGYRVILVADALCSSADETHDALLDLYSNRYSQQIETVSSAELLDALG